MMYPRNLQTRCVLGAYARQNSPKLKKNAQNSPELPRTELGTSGTTVVRTLLETSLEEPTRTSISTARVAYLNPVSGLTTP
jgi:hypothetical protein